MQDKICVAVVDDHPMFREGVVRTLKHEGDMEVVAEGGTADQAIEIAQKALPDIMLLDMNMPVRVGGDRPDLGLLSRSQSHQSHRARRP
jgi:DNA-binding NarL/FixJ family response regulator